MGKEEEEEEDKEIKYRAEISNSNLQIARNID